MPASSSPGRIPCANTGVSQPGRTMPSRHTSRGVGLDITPIGNTINPNDRWRIRVAKDAIVSDDLAKKFATEKDSPYVRWVQGEGLDIISAHYVADLNTVELKPWGRRGGR